MVRRNLLDTYFPPPSNLPQQSSSSPSSTSPPSSSSTSHDVSPSILITVLILAIAVILSASLYLLLRFLRRPRSSSSSTSSSPSPLPSRCQVTPLDRNPLLDSLPIFPYSSLPNKNGGDCAVCLSKFEKKDQLRLLPICCHAFHVECIDTWLNTNQSCPLCRSPVFLSESDILNKTNNNSQSHSFRVELGHVSNTSTNTSGEIRRTYSLGGSFDYVVDDEGFVGEIPSTSFRRVSSMEFKVDSTNNVGVDVLAGEVGTRGNGGWLKEYLSNSLSSSRTASFRGSGRWFFTGSSRRTTVDVSVGNHNVRESELFESEPGRFGDQIGEYFRWLSS